MTEKSCGTVPYIIKDGKIYYLLVKSKYNGQCGFPKGHVEEGESETETAFRETFEETSLEVTVNREFRYEMSYPMNNGNTKTAVYFIGKLHGGEAKRNGSFEDFEYLLLDFEEAYKALTFDNTKLMLEKANGFLIENI